MIGRTVSHYQILEKLGQGGMGVVYKALDTHLDRLVAIKVLPPERVADADRKRRFVQEAKAASALNHPNIVTIHDIDSADGIDFIAMELVAGKTLDGWIPRNGLRLNEALKYSVQVADALAVAHKAGIVHRDLKPGNVMVTDQGLIKVLDFGLAKLTEPSDCGGDEATRTLKPTSEEGTIMGTVSYMSPEQAEGKKVDARSDIFSFGALLYEMVTGRRAFQGDSRLSTLTAILREEPKPAGQVVEGLPRELERIIARCLRKDLGRRFQAMPDLKVALEELKEESESGTLGPVPAAKQSYRWRLPWTIALLAVTGMIVALWFAHSGAKAPASLLNAVPLTTYPGFQTVPSFSPDGSQIAFGWDGQRQDNQDIYVQVVGTAGAPLRLTTDPARDYSPAWSPDGRFIAFLRRLSQEKSAVLVIPALGGPERKVGEVLGRPIEEEDVGGPFLAWAPEGNSLVTSDRDSLTGPDALSLLSIETGEKRKLTFPPPQLFGDSSPAFSADGRTLAFIRSSDYGFGDLYLLPISKGLKPVGEPQRITFENAAASAAWLEDGHGIVYSQFGRPISKISAPGSAGQEGKPQALTLPYPQTLGLATSRRGGRLAYAHLIFHSNLWRLPAPLLDVSHNAHDVIKPGTSGAPFIPSTRNDFMPQFSPDGKRIAFVSDRSGNLEIWVCDSDGSNSTQLTSFRGPGVTTPRWSPDSTRIAFDADAEGETDIWVIGVNGGKPLRMTTHPANDGNPSWSRDGQWIYFDSARTGQQQLWKIPASGGEAIQVTRDGGFAPLESQDGKFLYYVKSLVETSLWKIPVGGGPGAEVLEGVSDYLDLAIVEGGVVFVPTSNRASLQFLSFTTNNIRLLAKFDRPIALSERAGLSVSPDGRWILCTQFEQAGSELMLVENFR
jgi:Tol biopolymer transport system component/serine/threonine protein kinase